MSCHLCEELIDEIFIRLPFKSLVRNTSLSKSWLSRISTCSFIRNHTLRSLTMSLPPQKYFIREHAQYKRNELGFSTQHFFLEKGYTGFKSDKYISCCFKIVGSCNGIICLFNRGGVQSITLWNPSIRRKLTIPAYPSSNKRVLFGFGFDPNSNDYKIVAMSYFSYEAAQNSYIYSLKTNTWSNIVSPTSKVYSVPFDSPACFFNGTLHWVVKCELNDIDHCCIVTFDLSTNVFGLISLPKPHRYVYALMIIKGCLAVIFGGGHCSIWVMREYNDVASWTKAFDIQEGILMNEDHKDSISYNHEAQTRSRLIVDSSYKVDMDMCVESFELIDKQILEDESYFVHNCSQLHCFR